LRRTGLDDESHIAFSKRLGDLDNIKRYMVGGRKPRYTHYELFDTGNVDEDGKVLDPNSPRAHFGKVRPLWESSSYCQRKN
jgi:alpha-ketoglutarate-dependent 2,4-dichlorophenoxyacetate dioxygenase